MFSLAVVMSWNVFKFCAALRGLGSVMILLVLSVVGFTYYAVVVTNYWPVVLAGGANSYSAFAMLMFFHLLLVMLLWSYFSAVLTDPGSVPPNWRPDVDEESGDPLVLTGLELGKPMLNSQQTASLVGSGIQKVRYCRKCNQLKPPRCHHCSACELFIFVHSCFYVNCSPQYEPYSPSPPLTTHPVADACFHLSRWKMHIENGSSLCVGRKLRWRFEL